MSNPLMDREQDAEMARDQRPDLYPLRKSLTQQVTEAGYRIVTESGIDRVGPLNTVTIVRGGKRTRRTARKYEEALEACARARGVDVMTDDLTTQE